VAPLDVEQANNLYIVRAALDAVAARLAAGRYTRELAHRGRLLLDVGRRAIASGYIPSAIEADIDFHLFIYEASGNPVISETTQPHWQHLRRVMAAVLSEEDLRVSVWDEHEAILRALEAGDASRAETLCRKHAEQTAGVLTTRLKAVISRAA
jgi:DNA-binding GntR family transcriptional regulator